MVRSPGKSPSPVPRPLVKARGAVHPLPWERESPIFSARVRDDFFPLPWGEGGRGTRSGEGYFSGGGGQAPSPALPEDEYFFVKPLKIKIGTAVPI